MIVTLTAAAVRDLEDIGDYIASDDPARARSFVAELRAACLGLADAPRGFPLVPRYADHAIRRRNHGRYAIFYRVDGERIVVIHVLHGARDDDAILS